MIKGLLIVVNKIKLIKLIYTLIQLHESEFINTELQNEGAILFFRRHDMKVMNEITRIRVSHVFFFFLWILKLTQTSVLLLQAFSQ